MSERSFSLGEVTVAVVLALVAQGLILAIFALPPPPAHEVEISDENSRTISVAITPVPILKKGTKDPAKLPKRWQRDTPTPVVGAKTETVPPSQQASTASVPNDRHLDAGVAGASSAAAQANGTPIDAGLVADNTGSAEGSTAKEAAGGEQGHAEGAADGTETDPLKGRAADMYRAQLVSWFAQRFDIRGKIPFDDLKRLKATATVSVSSDRKVTDFTVTSSGDPIFDEEVRSTLSKVKSSGIELPAPPPLYPEMLGPSLPVSFRCTIRSQCE